jgi:TRAP-type C4-dicarboxylate transport system permease small subunit
MLNMKLFSRRVAVIHASVICAAFACVSVLNYLVWTYMPDSRFDTLETVLWPFVKPVLSLFTLAVLAMIAFDPHSVRLLRKLSYFNHK